MISHTMILSAVLTAQMAERRKAREPSSHADTRAAAGPAPCGAQHPSLTRRGTPRRPATQRTAPGAAGPARADSLVQHSVPLPAVGWAVRVDSDRSDHRNLAQASETHPD